MSDSFGITPRSIQYIRSALGRIPEIMEARIFGSRALGNPQKSSDIDIALFGPESSETTARKLSEVLNEELPIPYHVDVVVFEACENEDLKQHISKIGKVLWQRDSSY